MLNLTRKRGERIRIGDAIVTIKRFSGGRALIGIEAPRDVPIVRLPREGDGDGLTVGDGAIVEIARTETVHD